MGLFNFFKKNQEPKEKVGGMEDFMTLIRVYYQSVLAANLGITNIGMLPDLATFKPPKQTTGRKQIMTTGHGQMPAFFPVLPLMAVGRRCSPDRFHVAMKCHPPKRH